MVADMRKRVILPGAVKAIREALSAGDEQYRVSRFAIKCLMSPGHLCNIEAGRKTPSEEVIHRIAAHLGVPVDAISYTLPISTEAIA